MVMFIIAIILMIPFIALKALEFVKWFMYKWSMDDPQEVLYDISPWLAILGLIIFFCELITCRM